MVRIVSDTSALYSTAQAKEAGFAVAPLTVTIAGKTYREFDEISAEQFVALIRRSVGEGWRGYISHADAREKESVAREEKKQGPSIAVGTPNAAPLERGAGAA